VSLSLSGDEYGCLVAVVLFITLRLFRPLFRGRSQQKEDEMSKLYFLVLIIIFLVLQEEPSFCGVTRTASFQIAVTIPEHVMSSNGAGLALPASTPFQFVQTQMVLRGNKLVQLTSIVVP